MIHNDVKNWTSKYFARKGKKPLGCDAMAVRVPPAECC